MTIRNLDRVLAPRRIAVIGASARPRAVGHLVLANMRTAGFTGTLMPVNPREAEIDGMAAFPDIDSLPHDPDLAIIATPPDTVPGLIAQLARRGCAGAVVITAGFGEGDSEAGMKLRHAMLEAARPATLRIIGPNCLGIVAPSAGVNASFSSAPLNSFHLILDQSGGGSRNALKIQLVTSYHRKPLPSVFLASASMWIPLRLKEAEGSCAFSNSTLLKSTLEKFGAYSLSSGNRMFVS